MTAKTVSNSRALSRYINEASNFLKKNPGNQAEFMAKYLGLFPDYVYSLFGIVTKTLELEGLGKVEQTFVELRCTHGPGYTWKGPCSYSDASGAEFDFNMPDA
jgi:hypothetical protein